MIGGYTPMVPAVGFLSILAGAIVLGLGFLIKHLVGLKGMANAGTAAA
jgi:hypothetical protein